MLAMGAVLNASGVLCILWVLWCMHLQCCACLGCWAAHIECVACNLGCCDARTGGVAHVLGAVHVSDAVLQALRCVSWVLCCMCLGRSAEHTQGAACIRSPAHILGAVYLCLGFCAAHLEVSAPCVKGATCIFSVVCVLDAVNASDVILHTSQGLYICLGCMSWMLQRP